MAKFDWEKLSKKIPKYKYRLNNEINKRPWKERMDEALNKYGWQVCLRCRGSRHPMFALCKKCREKQKLNLKNAS